MKFGIREIADVVFKAKKDTWIGNSEFKKGQPVLYIDSAKTSTIESAATTVYATGGRGNSRLITWEGEKTLTFTVEDALLSPIGFSILSGAGLFSASGTEKAMVHRTEMAEMVVHTIESANSNFIKVDISVDALTSENNNISNNAPIYVSILQNGSLISGIKHLTVDKAQSNHFVLKAIDSKTKSITGNIIQPLNGTTYDEMLNLYGLKTTMFPERSDINKVYKYPCIVDYYTEKLSNVTELVIDADNFGGYYYVEGTTYVRNENGKDMKMTLTFPKVKVQSNFTFNMASSGDPSTFSFVMDAMPDYTIFEATKKVLCAMQLIEEEEIEADMKPVLTLGENESVDSNIIKHDSIANVNIYTNEPFESSIDGYDKRYILGQDSENNFILTDGLYDESGLPPQEEGYKPEVYKYIYSTNIDNQSIECWISTVDNVNGLATTGLIDETKQQLEQGFNIDDVFSKDSNSSHIIGTIKIKANE